MKTKIKEIFTSIQGEGLYVGYKQLFVRFCKCNLSCKYCDTDYKAEGAVEYSVDDLIKICHENMDCHSISLTGGEPLIDYEFLKEFLPKCPLPVYLETNGTLWEELAQIKNHIDFIAMDIKLPSCSGNFELWQEHIKFLETAKSKNIFIKIVFDKNITEDEIKKCTFIGKNFDVELILQPKMNDVLVAVESEFIKSTLDKFLSLYSKTRVIPQMHKFLNVD